MHPTLLVKITDSVRTADGQLLHHWLPVPPYMATARKLVAWTFGRSEQAYAPEIET